MKKIQRKNGALYLSYGMSLASIIDQLKADGVTDFTKVTFDADSTSCCGCTDGYCYCPSSYTDIRFDWEA